MPEEQNDPMEVDGECDGYEYVIIWLDGRRECYNGDPDNSGLTSWTTRARYLVETGGMPAAPADSSGS